MKEFELQFNAIREGLLSYIPYSFLSIYTVEALEDKICGSPIIDVNFLKRTTVYNGYRETDLTIQHFWDVMNEFSQKQLREYVRFAWGRSRFTKFENETHKITEFVGANKESLPVAHTCFFELELPNYKNKYFLKNLIKIRDKLREKLIYAMTNCQDIVEEGSVQWEDNSELDFVVDNDDNEAYIA